MDNYYIFQHRRVAKRSVEPNQNYEQLLADEVQVNIYGFCLSLDPIYFYLFSTCFCCCYLVISLVPTLNANFGWTLHGRLL